MYLIMSKRHLAHFQIKNLSLFHKSVCPSHSYFMYYLKSDKMILLNHNFHGVLGTVWLLILSVRNFLLRSFLFSYRKQKHFLFPLLQNLESPHTLLPISKYLWGDREIEILNRGEQISYKSLCPSIFNQSTCKPNSTAVLPTM